jgi:hypothetical protein
LHERKELIVSHSLFLEHGANVLCGRVVGIRKSITTERTKETLKSMTDSTPKNALPVEEPKETDVPEKTTPNESIVCLDYSSFRMNSECFLRDMEQDIMFSMRRGIGTQGGHIFHYHNLPHCTTWDKELLDLSEDRVSKELKPVPASLWEQLEEEYSPSDDEEDEDDTPDHIPSFSEEEEEEEGEEEEGEEEEGEEDVPPLTDGDEEDDTSKNFLKFFDSLQRMRSDLASEKEKEVTASIEEQLHEKRRRAMIIAYNAVLRGFDHTPEVFNREVFEANTKRMMQALKEEQERVQAKVEARSMSLFYQGVYPTYEMSNIVQATGRAIRSTPPISPAPISTEELLSTEGKKRKRRGEKKRRN